MTKRQRREQGLPPMPATTDAQIADIWGVIRRWDETGCPFGRVLCTRVSMAIAGASLVAAAVFGWLGWLTVRVWPEDAPPRVSMTKTVASHPMPAGRRPGNAVEDY